MTVVWYVDGLKVSHVDSFEVTKFSVYLSSIYGGISVNRREIHDLLAIVVKCLDSMLEVFPEQFSTTADTPASDHLFMVWYEGKIQYLTGEQVQTFHHTIAQLLFMSSTACQDIQTAVAFLTKRIKNPYENDWVKLKQLLKYIKVKMELKLALSIGHISVLKCWVDASYVVHEDC